ncbi:MAG: phage holin family protein [Chloroflexota bacterium]|jgi:putative membrane protein
MRFLIRLLINAVAFGITFWLLKDQLCWDWEANSIFALLIVALVFGIVNAVIRPIITLLTCPLVILTLGLFVFVINVLMLWLTQWFTSEVLGMAYTCTPTFFWDYILGAIVLGIVSWGVSLLVPDSIEKGRKSKSG